MKIVNRTYRDITASESTIQKTPISDLVSTTSLPDGSLMHIAVKEGSSYESRKITTDYFKQKIYESVQNTLKTKYWDTHEFDIQSDKPSPRHDQEEDTSGNRPDGTSFADLVRYLKNKDATKPSTDPTKYEPDEVAETDPDGFVDHIYYDFDVLKRYVVLRDSDLQTEIDEIEMVTTDMDCHFAPQMELYTTKLNNNNETVTTNSSVNHGTTENDDYCQLKINAGNKISERTWIVPKTGNLVVYGWLDSSQCLNNKATPSAYCVLEGKINGVWEIISVCPVVPAKNMTYVGFNVLVKAGLEIRARTGFTCGDKSGQHPNEQDGYDSLSNSTPNGFKCMVYAKI